VQGDAERGGNQGAGPVVRCRATTRKDDEPSVDATNTLCPRRVTRGPVTRRSSRSSTRPAVTNENDMITWAWRAMTAKRLVCHSRTCFARELKLFERWRLGPSAACPALPIGPPICLACWKRWDSAGLVCPKHLRTEDRLREETLCYTGVLNAPRECKTNAVSGEIQT
jgi:hypothetical protein